MPTAVETVEAVEATTAAAATTATAAAGTLAKLHLPIYVTLVNNSSKTGLGAFNSNFIEVNSTIERKHALLRKTRQRYDEITE
ncbi:hypothetical protein PV326_003339 [Microctonus aethiopoides]|nr:hypothetical protein PV326_003339 [Microctonus aethiopoides]